MLVSRKAALLGSTSRRLMRAAGRAGSTEGRQAIVGRSIQRDLRRLAAGINDAVAVTGKPLLMDKTAKMFGMKPGSYVPLRLMPRA